MTEPMLRGKAHDIPKRPDSILLTYRSQSIYRHRRTGQLCIIQLERIPFLLVI
jgi:hypothetical protein